jgi:hypothetical protein
MPVEVAKRWDARLYPELDEAGGLPEALRRELARLPGNLMPDGLDEPFIARVQRGRRSSQVMIAAKVRNFHADFWDRGVQYGTGWVSTLSELAQAIVAFQVDMMGVDALARAFTWVDILDAARAHEREAGPFVEQAWQALRQRLAGTEPPRMRRLLPLVDACMQRPALRQLLPFTSLDRLCFSRTTGYPFTVDCPHAFPVDGDRFRVACSGGSDQDAALGEGPAEVAALLLEQCLPANCGPAIHGTADNVDR